MHKADKYLLLLVFFTNNKYMSRRLTPSLAQASRPVHSCYLTSVPQGSQSDPTECHSCFI